MSSISQTSFQHQLAFTNNRTEGKEKVVKVEVG